MLHRAHPDGIVAIGQPAHARLVGAIGRAWGRAPFANPPHGAETLLAAEQHEIGMLPAEIAPTLNPATGLPHAYLELTRADHLRLWRDAGPLMMTQSRYAALLVSRHGTWIFSQYEQPPTDPAERHAVASYLWRERAFQRRVRASLATEPAYAAAVTPPALARSHAIFTIWDRIAVHACYGAPRPEWGAPARYRWDRVPTAGGVADLTLAYYRPDHWTLDPWPLTVDALHLTGEGRVLTERFADEDAMRTAFANAPWVRWESHISPASERDSVAVVMHDGRT